MPEARRGQLVYTQQLQPNLHSKKQREPHPQSLTKLVILQPDSFGLLLLLLDFPTAVIGQPVHTDFKLMLPSTTELIPMP